jgi:hypothetical protein
VSASALREPSPFPYEENVRLEIPGNLPDPGLESRAFETESAELILEHCLANEAARWCWAPRGAGWIAAARSSKAASTPRTSNSSSRGMPRCRS